MSTTTPAIDAPVGFHTTVDALPTDDERQGYPGEHLLATLRIDGPADEGIEEATWEDAECL
jgi:hypothetical protein